MAFVAATTLVVRVASKATDAAVTSGSAADLQNVFPMPAESQVTVTKPGPAWVFTRQREQRTCASENCGSTGRIYYHQKIDVYQLQDGWARITERYDASCRGGISDYVVVGDNRCIQTNGVLGGEIAIWVPISSLTAMEPEDLGRNVSADARFLASSDDIDLYERQFLAGAREMVRRGYCTEEEMRTSGGFLKSVNRRNEPVYFVLCGNERPYLNVATGEVTRGR